VCDFLIRQPELNLKGVFDMFFNKGQRTNKFALVGIANQKVQNTNLTEIVKVAVFGPDNYMLRNYPESVLEEIIHCLIKNKIDDNLEFSFDFLR